MQARAGGSLWFGKRTGDGQDREGEGGVEFGRSFAC